MKKYLIFFFFFNGGQTLHEITPNQIRVLLVINLIELR